jgi:integrase
VFSIPGSRVKNGDERLVVLNRVAKSVIESQRGIHPTHVFAHARGKDDDPKCVTKMNNTAWKSARERAALEWPHHDALLPSEVGEPDLGRGEGVLDRLPQFSRNYMYMDSAQSQ